MSYVGLSPKRVESQWRGEDMRGLACGLLFSLAGSIVGGVAAYWLRWLQWEYYSPGSDHSFDYAWGIYILAGGVIGTFGGFLVALYFHSRR
jgi:hypothetical protein